MADANKTNDQLDSFPKGVTIEEETLPQRTKSSTTKLNYSESRAISAVSDRVKRLLESLEVFDSLYLCTTDNPFPDVVSKRIHRHCVHKYEVKDYYGVTRFYAAEMTSRCNYFFCSNSRGFEIFMYDLSGNLLFESVRRCGICLCLCGVDCCGFGAGEASANFRTGDNYIGNVVTEGTCSSPIFRVQNDYWDEKYVILGPKLGYIFPCRLCCISHFMICLPKSHTQMGKIIYGYDGLQEDRIPNPKTVGVIFPPRCSPEIKACLLTAAFMLDVTYFQRRGFSLNRILRYIFNFALIGLIVFGCYEIYNYNDNSTE